MLLQFGLLYYIATSITHKAHHFVARDRMLPLPMRFPCGSWNFLWYRWPRDISLHLWA